MDMIRLLLVLIGGLISKANGATLQASSIVVREGDNVQLTCATPLTSPQYQWKHDGKVLLGKTSGVLALTEVERASAGSYSCFVIQGAITEASNEVNITVLYLGVPFVEMFPLELLERETISFMCLVKSTDQIESYRWFYYGVQIEGEVKRDFIVFKGNRTQNGNYSCEITSKNFKKMSKNRYVKYLYLDTPVVTTAPPELIEGGSNVVTFTCHVSHSDTIFGYEWFFNSEPIIDQINKTYILQQPNRTNSGNYSCKATSKFFDKLSKDKIVLVRYMDTPFISIFPLQSLESETITFTCNVDTTDNVTGYRWLFNGEQIRDEENNEYILSKGNRINSGDYACEATSQYFMMNSTGKPVTYLYLDDPVVGVFPLTSLERETASLTCIVEGTDTIEYYKWYLGSDLIPGESQKQFLLSQGNRTSSGNYSCEVKSQNFNKRSLNVLVEFLYLDRPLLSIDDVIPMENKPITLQCTANYNDVLLGYHWYQNDRLVAQSANISQFRLVNGSRNNTGNYTCSVRTKNFHKLSNSVLVTFLYADKAILNTTRTLPPEHVNVTLTCYVNSNERVMNYTWYKGDKILDISLKNRYIIVEGNRSQSGNYSCKVTTKNFVERSMNVSIIYMYLDTPVLNISDASPIEGAIVTLTCDISTTDESISYSWFHNGVILHGRSSNIFEIQNGTREESGPYACHVSTRHFEKTSTNISVLFLYLDEPVLAVSNPTPKEDHPISFLCNVNTTDTILRYLWYHVGTQINISANDTFDILNGNREDSGNYFCQVITMNFKRTSPKIPILYLYLDTPVLNVSQPSPKEGDNITFFCSISTTDVLERYIWQHNSLVIPETSSDTLIIQNGSRVDTGNYTCQVLTKNFEKISANIFLIYLYLDVPVLTVSNPTPKEDHPISFLCNANTTDAILRYLWYHVGKVIDGITNDTFRLLNGSREDSGNYTCQVVTRNFNESSMEELVTFLYLDKPMLNISSKRPLEGKTTVTFTCMANYSDTGPYYEWYLDTDLLKQGPDNEFVIEQGNRNSSGNYSCVVTSQHFRRYSDEAQVLYLYPPSLIQFQPAPVNHRIEADIEQNFLVTCLIKEDGEPPAVLSWRKGGHSMDHDKYVLDFPFVKGEDYGNYSCNASNLIGWEAQSFTFIPLCRLEVESVKLFNFNSTAIAIRWDAPIPCAPTQDATHYMVYFKEADDVIFNAIRLKSDQFEYEFANLKSDIEFFIKISAINRNGEGVNTSILNVTTSENAPTKPRDFKVSSGRQKLILRWLEPVPTNGRIIRYHVCYEKVGSASAERSGKQCEITIGALTFYTVYKLDKYSLYDVLVRAENRAGGGPSVNVDSVWTDEEEPSPVIIKNVTTTPSLLIAYWMEVDHIYGKFNGYYVRVNGDLVCSGVTSTQCSVEDVRPYTQYNVTVQVKNSKYISKISCTSSRIVTTPAIVPPVYLQSLPMPKESQVTKDSFTLQMIRFDEINGPISYYDVIILELGDKILTPPRDPGNYTNVDIRDGVDGLHIAGRITCRSMFGETFIVGQKGIQYTTVSSRFRRSTLNSSIGAPSNKALKAGTYYTAFVRGHVTGDKYQSTVWYAPVKTAPAFSTLELGAIIAGAVVVVVVAVFLIKAKLSGGAADDGGDEEDDKKDSAPTAKSSSKVPMSLEKFCSYVIRHKKDKCYKFSQKYYMLNGVAYDALKYEHVNGYKRKKEYIATNGPFSETVPDFWAMIWKEKVSTIVMLTSPDEKRRHRCSKYWPDVNRIQITDFIITFSYTLTFADYVIRVFKLRKEEDESDERIVTHFQYLSWKEGCADVPKTAIRYLRFVRMINRKKSEAEPTVVHSSIADGRTATFFCINLLLKFIIDQEAIIVLKYINKISKYRKMRLSEDQYIFLHEFLLDYLEGRDKEVKQQKLAEYIQKNSEVIEDTDKTGLETEFEQLNKRTLTEHDTDDELLNATRNRYIKRVPCEDSRVRLSVNPELYDTEYIDANFIDSYYLSENFIATRAPLMKTVAEFWRMVWEYDCCTVVMLMSQEIFVYWPRRPSSPLSLKHLFIELVEESTYNDYILRQFRITNMKEGSSRLVYHFHYNRWPDEGSVVSPFGLADLVEQVKDWNAHNGDPPIVVHCSDGIGKTGVFIAIHNLIERLSEDHTINIYQAVKLMRQQRPNMIRTEDDYILCFRAAKEYLESFNM